MRPDIQQPRVTQLSLFGEDIEVPCWHELNENTRKDVVRHLARLMGRVQETGARQTAAGSGAQDE